MDSNEEISDNILEYLLDNGRECDSSYLTEGENVSTATDNEPIYGSEFDISLNPMQSSKKLEWDSSADVGSLPQKTLDKNPKLSTLERMALSNSASKLCVDDDDKLLAKIDKVLARSRQPPKTLERLTKKPPKLPTWATIDSASNASADTVIPNFQENIGTIKKQPAGKKLTKAYSQEFHVSDYDLEYQSLNYKDNLHYVSHSDAKYEKRISPTSEKFYCRPSKTLYSEVSTEMFVTRSVATEDDDFKAGNCGRPVSITPTNRMDVQDMPGSECRCMSADVSERTCPTHASLSSEHTRRLHREAVGELHMYRGLKEHLRSLRDYVAQLEQTWKFLDQTKSTTHSRREGSSSRRSHRRIDRVPSMFEESSAGSARTRTSEILSSPAPSPVSLKSDRSFELERLNLHDTDSSDTPTTQPTKPARQPRPKCCDHCSLKKPKLARSAPARQPSKEEVAVQTSDRRPLAKRLSENKCPAQREPIAFEVPVNGKSQSKDSGRPSSKTSLQEALQEKRPDFCQESARRQQALQEIAQLRRAGAMDCNAIPRLFSYHQLRKQTEQIYRQLPEVRFKNRDQKRKENITSNRIKASIYQKKLQSRVLQGQLNLPHSTCL